MFGYWRVLQSSPKLPIYVQNDCQRCVITELDATPCASSVRSSSLARNSSTVTVIRSKSRAQFLPPELLVIIFSYLPRSLAPDRDTIAYPALIQPDRNPTDDLYNLTIVCRQWNPPATCVLYKSVDVSSLRATTKLARTLQITTPSPLNAWQNEGPEVPVQRSEAARSAQTMPPSRFGTLIKKLRMPMRANCVDVPQLPDVLQRLFQQIVSSCPNLESLECSASEHTGNPPAPAPTPSNLDDDSDRNAEHVNVWMPLPFNPSKITVLYLSNTSKPFAFQPSILTPFTRLETLTLAGFRIDLPSVPSIPNVPTPTNTGEASSNSSSSSPISCVQNVETLVLAECSITDLSVLFPPTDSAIKLRHLQLHHCNIREVQRVTIPVHLHKRLETFVDFHSNLDLRVVPNFTNLKTFHAPGEKFWYAGATLLPPDLTHVSFSLLNVGDAFAKMSHVMLLLDGMEQKLTQVKHVTILLHKRSYWLELEERTREELRKRNVEFDVHAVTRKHFLGSRFHTPRQKKLLEYFFGRSTATSIDLWDTCSAEPDPEANIY